MGAMSPGDVLAGRYTLTDLLGRGGSGEVWRARDSSLARDVAVKVVDLAAGEDQATRRFQQEARSAAALNHPHVVAVYDVGSDAHRAFLVMELLPGPSLSELLRREGPLPPERAVALATQAAEGLEAVHGVGVVHRDVKPGNLVLDQHDRVKVVDFGIARLAEATGTQLTTTGTVVGSAAYLSPEQARGDSATPASDHYALGCTLMTLLTGEPPFTAEHPVAVLRQHLDDTPPRVRDRRPDVPQWLDDAVDGLLAKDPVRRSAGLAALLAGRPDPDGRTAVLPATGPAPLQTKVLPTPPPPQGARWAPLLAVGAAVLLLAIVVAVVVALVQDDDPPGTAQAPRDDATSSASSDGTTDAGDTGEAPPTSAAPDVDTGNAAAAIAALGEAIDAAAGSGELDEKTAESLGKKVEDLQKSAEEQKKPEEVDKVLDDLLKKLDDAEAKGDVTASAADRIRTRAEDVRAAQ